MKFGLHNDLLRTIVDTLLSNNKVSEVILFGSRAKGNYESGSDIDIALKGSEITQGDIAKLHSILEDVIFPYRLDLVVYQSIQEPALLEHIDRVGINLHQ